ncbi:MAG: hypothetical protein WC794_02385 [Candidatus Doudnabacteria bacterium]|jgi:hypothetical protein
MIEQELKAYLVEINQHLGVIRAKKNPGIWRAFFNGMFSALGYIAGLALVIVVLGWVLNKTGLLDSFQKQVKDFQFLTEQAKKIMTVGGQEQGTTTTITLPDGQKIQVNK